MDKSLASGIEKKIHHNKFWILVMKHVNKREN